MGEQQHKRRSLLFPFRREEKHTFEVMGRKPLQKPKPSVQPPTTSTSPSKSTLTTVKAQTVKPPTKPVQQNHHPQERSVSLQHAEPAVHGPLEVSGSLPPLPDYNSFSLAPPTTVQGRSVSLAMKPTRKKPVMNKEADIFNTPQPVTAEQKNEELLTASASSRPVTPRPLTPTMGEEPEHSEEQEEGDISVDTVDYIGEETLAIPGSFLHSVSTPVSESSQSFYDAHQSREMLSQVSLVKPLSINKVSNNNSSSVPETGGDDQEHSAVFIEGKKHKKQLSLSDEILRDIHQFQETQNQHLSEPMSSNTNLTDGEVTPLSPLIPLQVRQRLASQSPPQFQPFVNNIADDDHEVENIENVRQSVQEMNIATVPDEDDTTSLFNDDTGSIANSYMTDDRDTTFGNQNAHGGSSTRLISGSSVRAEVDYDNHASRSEEFSLQQQEVQGSRDELNKVKNMLRDLREQETLTASQECLDESSTVGQVNFEEVHNVLPGTVGTQLSEQEEYDGGVGQEPEAIPGTFTMSRDLQEPLNEDISSIQSSILLKSKLSDDSASLQASIPSPLPPHENLQEPSSLSPSQLQQEYLTHSRFDSLATSMGGEVYSYNSHSSPTKSPYGTSRLVRSDSIRDLSEELETYEVPESLQVSAPETFDHETSSHVQLQHFHEESDQLSRIEEEELREAQKYQHGVDTEGTTPHMTFHVVNDGNYSSDSDDTDNDDKAFDYSRPSIHEQHSYQSHSSPASGANSLQVPTSTRSLNNNEDDGEVLSFVAKASADNGTPSFNFEIYSSPQNSLASPSTQTSHPLGSPSHLHSQQYQFPGQSAGSISQNQPTTIPASYDRRNEPVAPVTYTHQSQPSSSRRPPPVESGTTRVARSASLSVPMYDVAEGIEAYHGEGYAEEDHNSLDNDADRQQQGDDQRSLVIAHPAAGNGIKLPSRKKPEHEPQFSSYVEQLRHSTKLANSHVSAAKWGLPIGISQIDYNSKPQSYKRQLRTNKVDLKHGKIKSRLLASEVDEDDSSSTPSIAPKSSIDEMRAGSFLDVASLDGASTQGKSTELDRFKTGNSSLYSASIKSPSLNLSPSAGTNFSSQRGVDDRGVGVMRSGTLINHDVTPVLQLGRNGSVSQGRAGMTLFIANPDASDSD